MDVMKLVKNNTQGAFVNAAAENKSKHTKTDCLKAALQ